MKTVSKTDFLALLETGKIRWPPIVFGSHVYSIEVWSDTLDGPLEVVRAFL